MTLSNPNTATIIYSYFFVIAALLAGISIIAKHAIAKHTDELKEQLSKITYALYNDGQTGLINKVDQLIENQNLIKIDVEVMKAKSETKTRARKV
jgi:hypothetical protein